MKNIIKFLVKVVLFIIGLVSVSRAIIALNTEISFWIGFWYMLSLFGGIYFMGPFIKEVEKFIKD